MVTDFGIARVAEAAPLTATGQVLGTVHYMSPEQVAGDQVDRRSDIYSLAVVAFFALSGRFPFESPTASAVLVAHVTKVPPSLVEVARTVPSSLARLVDRCLSKDPASRIQSCEELVMELRRVEATLPVDDVAAPRPGPVAISSDEAQAVWLRAAELQNHTGSRPAPAAEPRSHLVRQDPGSSAYQLDQVRNAAREAGISTQFVDRALAERGLAASAEAAPDAPVTVRDGIVPPYNWWIGGHSSIAFEATIPGEMPERDFDIMADIIGRAMNDAGTATTVGRSLKWASTDRQRKVQVSVLVRDGRTTIYVGERLKDLIAGLYAGIMAGGGGGMLGPVIGISVEALSMPLLIIPGVAATLGMAFGTARYFFRRTSRSRATVLKALTERLAEQARESIARRAVGPGMRQDMKLLR
jgi:serine/threonine-protein kinase